MATWKEKYNKKYGYEKNESHSLKEISKDTGVSVKGLKQIKKKGAGAWKTNLPSVRLKGSFKKNPNTKKFPRSKRLGKEQWSMARVYSAVMGGKASKVDKKELKMEKGGVIIPFENIVQIKQPRRSRKIQGDIESQSKLPKIVYYLKGKTKFDDFDNDDVYSAEFVEEIKGKGVRVLRDIDFEKGGKTPCGCKFESGGKVFFGTEQAFEGTINYLKDRLGSKEEIDRTELANLLEKMNDRESPFYQGKKVTFGDLVEKVKDTLSENDYLKAKFYYDQEEKGSDIIAEAIFYNMFQPIEASYRDEDGDEADLDVPAEDGYGYSEYRNFPTKMYNEGGEVVDLFEQYETLPKKIQDIIEFYMSKYEEGDYDYSDSKEFLEKMEKEGYTFEYGLDNEPYDLKRIYYYGGEIERKVVTGITEEPSVSETIFIGANPYDVSGQKEAEELNRDKYRSTNWYLTAEYPEVAKVLRMVAPNLWIYYKYMQRLSISYKDMIRFSNECQNYFNGNHKETFLFDLSRPKGTRGVYRADFSISDRERDSYEPAYKKGQQLDREGQFPIPVEIVDVEDRYLQELAEKKQGKPTPFFNQWKQTYDKGGCFASIGKSRNKKTAELGSELETGELGDLGTPMLQGSDRGELFAINGIYYNNYIAMSDNGIFSWGARWKHKKTGLFFPYYQGKSYNFIVLVHELAHCLHYQRQLVRFSKVYGIDDMYNKNLIGTHDWEFVHCLCQILMACKDGMIPSASMFDREGLRVQYLLDGELGRLIQDSIVREEREIERLKPQRQKESGERFGYLIKFPKRILNFMREQRDEEEWQTLLSNINDKYQTSIYELLLLKIYLEDFEFDVLEPMLDDPAEKKLAKATFVSMEQLKTDTDRQLQNHFQNVENKNSLGNYTRDYLRKEENELLETYPTSAFENFQNWNESSKDFVMDKIYD